MTTNEKALLLHEEWKGKLKTTSKAKVASRKDLALAYIPSVAEPYKTIAVDPEAAYRYIIRSNTIAVVSDGSAILGLGNIGPLAAMPVIEGKAVLSEEFGGVNASPICLDTQDTQEVIETVVCIAPVFGGTDLEDILVPRHFEVEEALKERLDVPVFHGGQRGAAVAALTGATNSLELTGKREEGCRMVVNGAGSAGIAIIKLLLVYGFAHITMCDRSSILSRGADDLNRIQEKVMDVINSDHRIDTLVDTMKDANIFAGVSAPGTMTQDMVAPMNKDATLFVMANPVLKIMPELAKATGARVVRIGRSDSPNQVNNVVVFPGISKDVLEDRASAITEETKLAVAEAIARLVDRKDLNNEGILSETLDPRAANVVSSVVKDHTRKQ